ncbi:hypothetical protein OH76DRAFT_1200717 [Lentinus brumalis]|uniref:Uncharacterized protein n=1 Tax=Lentinus brumalis TaxID=2498619 RepID=A0A371CT65_9APHY|nr:hypothetical protein OH76DRAFT_1200717 [Polyporus brumalis]
MGAHTRRESMHGGFQLGIASRKSADRGGARGLRGAVFWVSASHIWLYTLLLHAESTKRNRLSRREVSHRSYARRTHVLFRILCCSVGQSSKLSAIDSFLKLRQCGPHSSQRAAEMAISVFRLSSSALFSKIDTAVRHNDSLRPHISAS